MAIFWGSIHTWVMIVATQSHWRMVLMLCCWTNPHLMLTKKVYTTCTNHQTPQISLHILKMIQIGSRVSHLKPRWVNFQHWFDLWIKFSFRLFLPLFTVRGHLVCVMLHYSNVTFLWYFCDVRFMYSHYNDITLSCLVGS